MTDPVAILLRCGVRPTSQRVAIADYILGARSHPSADEILAHVKKTCPAISRATVYNTLNLLVEKGLVTTQILREGTVVFDPIVDNHHHFIDEQSGRIYDIPWEALRVSGTADLKGFDVRRFQVVLRGRRRR
ncbi:MAG: transcriptional repressor [candidate division Zixibacteria bacterium]|nr:transcriptional repressor [candidate division Zixibacteria bacterium]